MQKIILTKQQIETIKNAPHTWACTSFFWGYFRDSIDDLLVMKQILEEYNKIKDKD